MRFDNCFCTNSICAPSRATILTGTYSHVNGVHDLRHDVRRPPADVPQAAAGGRLPDRHRRQVAPRPRRARPDRLRLLERPARPGRLPRPGVHRAAARRRSIDPATSPTSSPTSSLDWLDDRDQDEPVLPACATTRRRTALGAGRRSTRDHVRGRRDSRAGDVQRRLRAPRAGRRAAARMRIDRDLTERDLERRRRRKG